VLNRDAAPMKARSAEFALLAGVSMALCAAVAAAQGLRENAFGNMGMVHLWEAAEVLAGRGFGRSWEQVFYPDLFTRPTYTLYLAPWLGAIGRNFDVLRPVVAATQGLLNAVTALAIAWTLSRVGAGRAARIAAWGVVLHPVLVSQAATFVDTALFTCAFVGAYASIASLTDGASRSRRLLCGAAMGLAVLTRSTALTVAPALALAVWRGHATFRARLAAAGLVAVGTVAVLAPWFVRNHALTDRFMLSTVDSVNLWMGNNPSTAEFLREGRSLDELPGRERFDASERVSVDEQLRRYDAGRAEATAFMRSHPGETASLAAGKAGDLWSPRPAPRTTRSGLGGLKDAVGMAWTIPLYALARRGWFAARRAGGARWLGRCTLPCKMASSSAARVSRARA
jgi:hypothetical protein